MLQCSAKVGFPSNDTALRLCMETLKMGAVSALSTHALLTLPIMIHTLLRIGPCRDDGISRTCLPDNFWHVTDRPKVERRGAFPYSTRATSVLHRNVLRRGRGIHLSNIK
eukprot:CAMPEP_0119323934 /NCGR_PEP_ID=MMETSP1333-20130426/61981_1 /TAXON_ID=418940 /ORGANISM="Scyphosphaera apsteinii, Strain RCC1455" /LENGTH=109 /DNA_ID=CAMNT_0007331507 /DNA_START=280 /DNA_END=609 /DNA_ORIENTATION=-